VNEHPGKQDDSKTSTTLFGAPVPSRLEDDRENEGVNYEHEQWIEKGPCHAHEGPSVAPYHFALYQRENEVSIPPLRNEHI
jgi:hypothetical protein